MDDKTLFAAIAATLQRIPAATAPIDTVTDLVIANNRLVADAAAEMMTLETVPQPPRPLAPVAPGGDK